MATRTDASTGELVEAPTGEEIKPDKPTVELKIYSPFQSYFDGLAYSITALNRTGPFDILPQHHNFIALLRPGDVVIQGLKGEERVHISGGLMHVKKDIVRIFLDV